MSNSDSLGAPIVIGKTYKYMLHTHGNHYVERDARVLSVFNSKAQILVIERFTGYYGESRPTTVTNERQMQVYCGN